jgi:hypothetical protein
MHGDPQAIDLRRDVQAPQVTQQLWLGLPEQAVLNPATRKRNPAFSATGQQEHQRSTNG